MAVSAVREGKSGPNFVRGPGRDPECLSLRLGPPSALEEQGAGRLDPTTLELFSHKIDAIVDEGQAVFEGLAMSETIQTGDGGVSIFTASGDMAATSAGVYMHAALNYGPIKYIMKHYLADPTVGVRDGDLFFVNETLSGCVHPYDMFVNMPVFHDGALVAWVGCGGHQGEAGGKDPGGWSPTARSRYEEGFRVTPLKIGENFRLKTDHLECIVNMVRNPRHLALDIKTRAAVCLRLRERLLREIQRRDVGVVAAGLRKIIERAAVMARERVRSLNDGTYRWVAFLDTVGPAPAMLRVPLTLTKRGDQLILDYTGASPEHGAGPYHAYWHLTQAFGAAFFFTYLFRGLPLNIGCFDPIEVIAPAGTWLNASPEVAHANCSSSGRLVAHVLHQAAMRMLYDSPLRELTSAPVALNLLIEQFGGQDQYGFPVAGISSNNNASGQGARYDLDGEHVVGFYWAPAVDAIGAEEMESKFPLLFLSRNVFETNQVGYGRQRGGLGMCDICIPWGVPGIASAAATGTGDLFTMNVGLFGGYSGPTNPLVVIRNSGVRDMLARTDPALSVGMRDLLCGRPIPGDYQFMTSSQSGLSFGPDDIIVGMVGSGGGYGDVLERLPELVAQDVQEGVISADVARDIYGVVIHPQTCHVDLPATSDLRERQRAERLRRGRPYGDFVREWEKLRPPAEVLRYYGPWPGHWPAAWSAP